MTSSSLPHDRRAALARIALADGPQPTQHVGPDGRTIVRSTPALHSSLPTRNAVALWLLDAPDGWSVAPPSTRWTLHDWLDWVDRTAPERAEVREALRTSLTWGRASTWEDALRQRDLATIAQWLRDERSPERIAAHRTAAHGALKAAAHAPWLKPEDLQEQPAAVAFHLRDQEALLAVLLATGAVPDFGALFEAVDHPNPRLTHRLMDARPAELPWDFATKGLTTPMESAVSNPWSTVVEVLDLLERMGTPFDRPGLSRQPLLHSACRQGNRRAVRWLLEHGVDPNAQDPEYHQTALHEAAAQNDPVLIDLLVAAGADVHAGHQRLVQDRLEDRAARHTPLHTALLHGAGYALEALLAHGASLTLSPDRPYRSNDDGSDSCAARLASTVMERLGFKGSGATLRTIDAQRIGRLVEEALLQRTAAHAQTTLDVPLTPRARPRL